MEKKKRIDFQSNQAKIQEAFVKFFSKKKRRPTICELAEYSGLSEKTVFRHLKKLGLPKFVETYKILTDNVLMALYSSAKAGKAPEVKLWMQLIEGWNETTGVKHSGEIKIDKIKFVRV